MEGLLPPASAAIAIASEVGRSGLALWLDRIGCCLFFQFILAFGCCYLFLISTLVIGGKKHYNKSLEFKVRTSVFIW